LFRSTRVTLAESRDAFARRRSRALRPHRMWRTRMSTPPSELREESRRYRRAAAQAREPRARTRLSCREAPARGIRARRCAARGTGGLSESGAAAAAPLVPCRGAHLARRRRPREIDAGGVAPAVGGAADGRGIDASR